MKKLIILIVLVVAGFVIYEQMNKPLSPEGEKLQALENDFIQAQKLLKQAERAAGVSGVDTTSQFELAVSQVKVVKEKLIALKEELKDEAEIQKAEKMEREINQFLQQYPL